VISNSFAQMGGGGLYNVSGAVTVNNSTVSGNSTTANGGGLYNDGGSMTLRSSTVSGNSASSGLGGGIFNRGSLTIGNSTLSGNQANGGGGIFNRSTLTISNSTLSNNSANSGGGISHTTPGRLSIDNSIVSGNKATEGREILFSGGTVQSLSYNLLGFGGSSGLSGITPTATNIIPNVPLNRILAPLANNGGLTKTHALVMGSPAINAGDPNSRLTIDQRGEKRGRAGLNTGSRIDIGAYEATSSVIRMIGFNQTFPLTLPTGSSATPIENWIQRILGLLARN
jgi:hypothetical protein